MENQCSTVNYYAILIGLDSYADKPLQASVEDVNSIGDRLEESVRPVQIMKFLAPHKSHQISPLSGGGVLWPTYENVTRAFRETICKASKGDGVYIHFSGHGTRGDPHGEFSNVLTGDLALVLFEKDQESKPAYLWGTTLARLLSGMVEKGLNVTLVLDCCFAASIYRLDDPVVRFVPYDPDVDRRHSQKTIELTEEVGGAVDTTADRDASMQPNWLLNPDRYAILAACGPFEEAREIELEDGRKHGALSYLLTRVLGAPEGSRRRHREIYSHLRALLIGFSIRQTPVLYGNGSQAFFGRLNIQSDAVLFPIIRSPSGKTQLQAGQAHGFSLGDSFSLFSGAVLGNDHPSGIQEVNAYIISIGPFISDLKVSETHSINVETGWTAAILKQSSLGEFTIRLDPRVPDHEIWTSMLEQRSIATERKQARKSAFSLTINHQNEYEILDASGQNCLPTSRGAKTRTLVSICDTITHLIKFECVKGLINPASNDWLEDSCNVRMVARNWVRFRPGDLMVVEDDEEAKFTFRLEVENKAASELYVSVYNLGPERQVKSLTRGTYEVVPPRQPDGGESPIFSRKIKTTIPHHLRQLDRGCNDTIKVFVTSHPTCFDSLVLPKLETPPQPLEAVGHGQREDREPQENWAAINFFVYTRIQDSGGTDKQRQQ